MTTSEDTSVRCSAWIREQGVDPIGTAGSYTGFLLVEWPLPWPRDLSEIPELTAVHEALAGTGMRLQGLVPLFGDEEARRVVRYRQRPGPYFTGYERAERVVPVERVEGAAVALARGEDGDPEWAVSTVTDDLLVCTHGKRDVCCGAHGTALVMDLSADPARFGGQIRLWRTSHTGGHRFAPTAIVLPQGTAWAFLDADALRRITRRTGSLDDLLPRYRGSPAMAAPALQAVEREAFRDIGWEWLDWGRAGRDLGNGQVEVTGQAPTGEVRSWTAAVEVTRLVPVPECGHPITESRKAEPELIVTGLHRTTVHTT